MITSGTISRRLMLTLSAAAGLGMLGYVTLRPDRSRVVQLSADYPDFATLADITAAADDVVLARFLSSSEGLLLPAAAGGDSPEDPQRGATLTAQQQRDMGVPSTFSLLSVSQAFKGALQPGERITVTQPGGSRDGQLVREAHTPLLSAFAGRVPHQSFLLMLRQQGGLHDVLSPSLGIHGVDDRGSLIALDPASGQTRPATAGGRRLTLNDLGRA